MVVLVRRLRPSTGVIAFPCRATIRTSSRSSRRRSHPGVHGELAGRGNRRTGLFPSRWPRCSSPLGAADLRRVGCGCPVGRRARSPPVLTWEPSRPPTARGRARSRPGSSPSSSGRSCEVVFLAALLPAVWAHGKHGRGPHGAWWSSLPPCRSPHLVHHRTGRGACIEHRHDRAQHGRGPRRHLGVGADRRGPHPGRQARTRPLVDHGERRDRRPLVAADRGRLRTPTDASRWPRCSCTWPRWSPWPLPRSPRRDIIVG